MLHTNICINIYNVNMFLNKLCLCLSMSMSHRFL